MKKILFFLLVINFYSFAQLTQGAWQYGGLNQGALQNSPSGVTYDTCWCKLGSPSAGTVSPASVADSSTATNHKMTFTAAGYTGYSFVTWKSKQGKTTWLSSTATAPVCTVTISANDTIYDSLLIYPSPPSISYASTFMYGIQGSAITANNITNSGGVITSISSTPTLPTGLAFDGSGNILGTPTATVTDSTEYIITASNLGGSSNFSVWMAIFPTGSIIADDTITVAATEAKITAQTTNGTVSPSFIIDSLTHVFHFSATPNEHYIFNGTGWTSKQGLVTFLNNSNLTSACSLTTTGTDTIIAPMHALPTYTVTLTNSTPPGTLSPATGSHDSGAVVPLSYTPPLHYKFTIYNTTGGVIFNPDSTSFILTSNGTITVLCHSIQYTVTMAATNGTTVPSIGAHLIDSATVTSLGYVANGHFTFDYWVKSLGTITFNVDSTTFFPSSDATITASFTRYDSSISCYPRNVRSDGTVAQRMITFLYHGVHKATANTVIWLGSVSLGKAKSFTDSTVVDTVFGCPSGYYRGFIRDPSFTTMSDTMLNILRVLTPTGTVTNP
jgi:hypothetical protein